MKAKDRRQLIVEMISREGRASVDELAARPSVSAETIRRDLAALDDAGAIKKIHGGATRPGIRREGSFSERLAENAAAKKLIADKLFDVVADGATVMIDTGSTTLACAVVMAVTKSLTVITNSVRVASVFSEAGRHDVLLLGGQFAADNAETLGEMTIRQLQELHADYALLSPAAIDGDTGMTDASFGEASVARVMTEQADQLIVVADQSKFQKRAAFLVSRLETIDVLVCDVPPVGPLLQRLQSCNVSII